MEILIIGALAFAAFALTMEKPAEASVIETTGPEPVVQAPAPVVTGISAIPTEAITTTLTQILSSDAAKAEAREAIQLRWGTWNSYALAILEEMPDSAFVQRTRDEIAQKIIDAIGIYPAISKISLRGIPDGSARWIVYMAFERPFGPAGGIEGLAPGWKARESQAKAG